MYGHQDTKMVTSMRSSQNQSPEAPVNLMEKSWQSDNLKPNTICDFKARQFLKGVGLDKINERNQNATAFKTLVNQKSYSPFRTRNETTLTKDLKEIKSNQAPDRSFAGSVDITKQNSIDLSKQNNSAKPNKETYKSFVKYWDHEPSQYFIKSTGIHSGHLDKMMGMAFEDLEHLSVRDQRQEFKRRATEIHRAQNQSLKRRIRGQGAEIFKARLEAAERDDMANSKDNSMMLGSLPIVDQSRNSKALQTGDSEQQKLDNSFLYDDSIMSDKLRFNNKFGSNPHIYESPFRQGTGYQFAYTRTIRRGCKHLLKMVENAQLRSREKSLNNIKRYKHQHFSTGNTAGSFNKFALSQSSVLAGQSKTKSQLGGVTNVSHSTAPTVDGITPNSSIQARIGNSGAVGLKKKFDRDFNSQMKYQPRDYHRMSLQQQLNDSNTLPEVTEKIRGNLGTMNTSMYSTSQAPALKDAIRKSPYGKQQQYELKHAINAKYKRQPLIFNDQSRETSLEAHLPNSALTKENYNRFHLNNLTQSLPENSVFSSVERSNMDQVPSVNIEDSNQTDQVQI